MLTLKSQFYWFLLVSQTMLIFLCNNCLDSYSWVRFCMTSSKSTSTHAVVAYVHSPQHGNNGTAFALFSPNSLQGGNANTHKNTRKCLLMLLLFNDFYTKVTLPWFLLMSLKYLDSYSWVKIVLIRISELQLSWFLILSHNCFYSSSWLTCLLISHVLSIIRESLLPWF